MRAGVVVSFDPETGKHHVHYEDGDERDYVLLDKTWTFAKRSAEV